MKRFLARALNMLRPARAENELAREMRAHLALLEEEYQRLGLSEDEAPLLPGGLWAASRLRRIGIATPGRSHGSRMRVATFGSPRG